MLDMAHEYSFVDPLGEVVLTTISDLAYRPDRQLAYRISYSHHRWYKQDVGAHMSNLLKTYCKGMFNGRVDVGDFLILIRDSVHHMNLSALGLIPWVEVRICSLVGLSLGWAGWVLMVCILHIAPVCLVLIKVTIVGNWDEVWVLVVEVVLSPVSSWLICPITVQVSRCCADSCSDIGAFLYLMSWV